MPIECRPSNLSSDVRCAICGQGFLVYGDSRISRERVAVRESVRQALRHQHETSQHAADGFTFEWAAEAHVN
jgi:hypothetical protein